METILRVAAVYGFLWFLFRIAGKRTLSEITTFDFVLLLIISEGTQQALVGQDFSVTGCFIVVATLVALDVGTSILKQRIRGFGKFMDGTPVVIVQHGQLLKDRMDRERIDEADILEAARKQHGLERMEQIKYVILELSGGLTVIPKEGAGG